MKNWEIELKNRTDYIKHKINESKSDGIIFGNSGGKDSALVGVLCKLSCDNTIGVIMPCSSAVNYTTDLSDAIELAQKFNIETRTIDLTKTRAELLCQLSSDSEIKQKSLINIAPRLRMTTLYAIAMNENLLVAGTGNKSERFMGYFTKWGDGAFDFNPIADLYVSEIYEFMQFLGIPESIIKKSPSAGLFEGQTDENDMGVSYSDIEKFIKNGTTGDKLADEIIIRYNKISEHKRKLPSVYGEN